MAIRVGTILFSHFFSFLGNSTHAKNVSLNFLFDHLFVLIHISVIFNVENLLLGLLQTVAKEMIFW